MDVKLVMFKRDGQRKDFMIQHDKTLIGRGEDCVLQIPLLSVSRRHCELMKGDQELSVRDLASSNGIYVNNQRVNEKELKAGDRLSVGPVIFTVQIDGEPIQIRPVKSKARKAAEAVPAEAQAEEVVDLEADVEAEEEADPIAALEALAAEHGEEKKEKEEEEAG